MNSYEEEGDIWKLQLLVYIFIFEDRIPIRRFTETHTVHEIEVEIVWKTTTKKTEMFCFHFSA